MKMYLHTYELPLRHTFTISRESADVQPTLIVELVDGNAHGYGESTTSSYYGSTIDNMTAALDAVRPDLEPQSLEDPAALWAELNPALETNSFAQCALDQAAHDLWGKKRGQPVYQLWGLSTDRVPASNYTIGIDTIETMVAKMREYPDWPIYKIKKMIQRARELGLHVMVGCMTESTVGISAIAQLLPLLDYVDMDGAVLLKEDIATGVTVEQGRCIYPRLPGHGVQLVKAGLHGRFDRSGS